MVVLARSAVCLGLLGIAACYPTPDPPWLVTRPEMFALRIEVVREGEPSAVVASPPADRVRTEMLPGDTARMRPFVVDPQRVYAPEELDVAYFACFGVSCADALRDPATHEPCTAILEPGRSACTIGRGIDAELTLPSEPLELLSFGVPQVFAVAGVPGVASTDECIDALRSPTFGDLGDCMMVERSVAIGPLWVLSLLQDAAQDMGSGSTTNSDSGTETGPETDTDTDTGSGGTTGDVVTDDPPPEVYFEWPNFNPEVERFAVQLVRGDATRAIDAEVSDHIEVRPGDRVVLRLDDDPRDAQSWAIRLADGSVGRNHEFPRAVWRVNAPIHFEIDPSNSARLTWTVARDSPSVRFDVLLDDGRGGVGWGSIHFEVDDTSG